MNKKSKKTISKKAKKLLIKELEKRVAPSAGTGKKPSIPGPYAPGTLYGLAKRCNIN